MNGNASDTFRMLNNRFYRENGSSFTRTRNNSWPGWERCCDAAGSALARPGAHVLDVACGNMRFGKYLKGREGTQHVRYTGIDVHPMFESLTEGFAFVQADLLQGERPDVRSWTQGGYALCACFGFMHHVHTQAQRVELLQWMLRAAAPGGCVAVSLWRFADDAGLRRRAEETTVQAVAELGIVGLGEGDYLLGWNNEPGAYRYCHSFSDADEQALVNACADAGVLVDSFGSDGRTAKLNRYLVWEAI